MPLGSETLRAVLLAFFVLDGALAWFAIRAARTAPASPERLIAEFRTVRLAALLLTLTAGTSLGLAAAHEQISAGALDVTFSVGFVAVASVAVTKDPRQALIMLALGLAAHGLTDIAHRPGFLSPDLGPRWFFIAAAVFDVAAGAICYLPILRR